MGRYPRLKHAPIVEAVVDFRVVGLAEESLPAIGDMAAEVGERYVNQERVRAGQAAVRFTAGESAAVQTEQRDVGLRLSTEDGRNVAMLTVEGFTLSRLHPYVSWEALREESQSLWTKYAAATRPGHIARAALRYINRLDLPEDIRDLKDYLTAPPELPPRLEQVISGYASRVFMPLRSIDGSAAITQQMTIGETGGAVVLLDIDVSKTGEIAVEGDAVWALLEQLRQDKNRLFFESITERMEALCQ